MLLYQEKCGATSEHQMITRERYLVRYWFSIYIYIYTFLWFRILFPWVLAQHAAIFVIYVLMSVTLAHNILVNSVLSVEIFYHFFILEASFI